jgi:glycosyltransferase involved in cell wall biosynthesis
MLKLRDARPGHLGQWRSCKKEKSTAVRTDPLVSIIVPAFNAGPWIAEALESALNQTHRPIEVIVAENRSTDDTLAIVSRFGRSVRIVDAPIRGCGAARNAGLTAARGEIIQWLDADDVLERWKVERQLEHLCETNADIVWGPFWTYEPVGGAAYKPRRRRDPAIGDDVVAGLLSADGWVQMGATLSRRREPLASLRFEDDHRVEDMNYLIRAVFAGARFAKSRNDSGLLFRQHANWRASSVPNRLLAMASADNARLAARLWSERGEMTTTRRNAVVDVLIFATRSLFRDDRESFESLLDELRTFDSGFVRRLPTKIRALSLIVGYRNAEEIATRLRTAAGLFRRLTPGRKVLSDAL